MRPLRILVVLRDDSVDTSTVCSAQRTLSPLVRTLIAVNPDFEIVFAEKGSPIGIDPAETMRPSPYHLILIEAAEGDSESEWEALSDNDIPVVAVFDGPSDISFLPDWHPGRRERFRAWISGRSLTRKRMLFTAALCPDTRTRKALATEGFPLDRIHVLPPSVDLPTATASVQMGRPFRFLFCFGNDESQGIAALGEAVSHYEEAFGKDVVAATLYRPGASALRDFALPLTKVHVRDTKPWNDLSPYDAVIFWPSQDEPFWDGHLAAMAAGVPVITTEQGADGILARDGTNALLYVPNRPRQLGNRIARLINDPALREQLGTAARASLERQWTHHHRAERLVSALRHIVDLD